MISEPFDVSISLEITLGHKQPGTHNAVGAELVEALPFAFGTPVNAVHHRAAPGSGEITMLLAQSTGIFS